MIPLEVELNRPLDIWLSYHPGSGRIPRVRHMIDWLIEAFSPARFPWFKEEFVHPHEFKDSYMGEPLTQLFGDFQPKNKGENRDESSGEKNEAAQCRQARH